MPDVCQLSRSTNKIPYLFVLVCHRIWKAIPMFVGVYFYAKLVYLKVKILTAYDKFEVHN